MSVIGVILLAVVAYVAGAVTGSVAEAYLRKEDAKILADVKAKLAAVTAPTPKV